ncbi:hypothetical protein GSI_05090 [Ganoderma sinense ZZ0214-1]|uniref:Uncharacterized protein n=1 Tax=Ganoderma sinense ZZ0214-1 TaxID=1077348 RepID=A0A2G8SGU1_9APHY|nr:hypothetical protein GSI_05090 [Ganoderma sinense ZZ0214-1]
MPPNNPTPSAPSKTPSSSPTPHGIPLIQATSSSDFQGQVIRCYRRPILPGCQFLVLPGPYTTAASTLAAELTGGTTARSSSSFYSFSAVSTPLPPPDAPDPNSRGATPESSSSPQWGFPTSSDFRVSSQSSSGIGTAESTNASTALPTVEHSTAALTSGLLPARATAISAPAVTDLAPSPPGSGVPDLHPASYTPHLAARASNANSHLSDGSVVCLAIGVGVLAACVGVILSWYTARGRRRAARGPHDCCDYSLEGPEDSHRHFGSSASTMTASSVDRGRHGGEMMSEWPMRHMREDMANKVKLSGDD